MMLHLMDGFLIAGIILVFIGIVFLTLGIIFCVKGNNKKKYSGRTTGKVIDMCKSAKSFNSGGDGEGLHFGVYVSTGNTSRPKLSSCPIFTYTVNGMQYTRADNVAYDVSMIRHMMERTVDIFYNPSNPADAKLVVRSPLLIVGIVFILVSVLMLGMGMSFIML